jgi:hypothetical protein
MDDFHERLARVALVSAGKHGFALAGGYAVQVHGFLERPSEDVDLFTTMDAEDQFETAVAGVVAAYKADGLTTTSLLETPAFARLLVTDAKTDNSAKVELGIDWRAHPPTILSIGPVLFDRRLFAHALIAVERLPIAEFTAYDLSEEAAEDLVTRLTSWATAIIRS